MSTRKRSSLYSSSICGAVVMPARATATTTATTPAAATTADAAAVFCCASDSRNIGRVQRAASGRDERA